MQCSHENDGIPSSILKQSMRNGTLKIRCITNCGYALCGRHSRQGIEGACALTHASREAGSDLRTAGIQEARKRISSPGMGTRKDDR